MVDINKVEEYRKKLGIPKTVIARKCDITVTTYDNWLSKPSMISAVSAKSLADAFDITDTETLLAIFFAPNVQTNVSA